MVTRLFAKAWQRVSENPVVSATLALLLVVAAISRLWAIGDHSIWLDEAITVGSMESLSKAAMQKFHPPLHYTGLWFYSRIFGESAGALRSFSALFGIGTVWISYLIGRQLFSSRAPALLGALMVAALPAAIFFSREARMYAMWQFFFTLSFYGVLRLRGAKSLEWKTVAIYLGGMLAGQLTHHYMAFYALPCVIAAFLALGDHPFKKTWQDYQNWLKLHGPIIVAAVILFAVLAYRKDGIGGAIAYIDKSMSRGSAELEIQRWVSLVYFVNWVHRTAMSGGVKVASFMIVALGIATVAMYYDHRAQRRGAVMFALALVVPLVLINWMPIRNYTRLFLPSVTLVGIGLGYLLWLPVRAMGRPGWFWSTLLIGIFMYTIWPFQKMVYTLELEPWNDVCEHLAKNDSGNDGVFVTARYMTKPFLLCYKGSGTPTGFTKYGQIENQIPSFDQVWLAYSHAWNPKHGDGTRSAVRALKKTHRLVRKWKVGKDLTVYRFQPRPAQSSLSPSGSR